jgi:carbon monoxide dehydrogenase subunit G
VESIQATRESVWDFVMDPTRIGYCGPGVERVDLIDDGRFTAIAKVGIGVISARFHIDADMSTLKPGEEATVSVRAKAAGSAVEGVGRIKLLDSATGTTMEWQADVSLAGRLASLGARLIEGAAKQMIEPPWV